MLLAVLPAFPGITSGFLSVRQADFFSAKRAWRGVAGQGNRPAIAAHEQRTDEMAEIDRMDPVRGPHGEKKEDRSAY